MKPSIKIILLMLLCAVILAVYGLMPQKPILVGDWGFRQIPLYKLLTDTTNAYTTSAEAALEEEEANIVEKTDSTKQRILLIGDSMVGQLCYRMSEYAKENGHELTCVSWVSSTTAIWAKCDTLQNLVNRFRPTYIFVSLGSNELYSRDMDGLESHINSILSQTGNIPTIWIGPPNWCKDGGINDLLKKKMGPRAFFPSLNLTFTRMPDGHHPDNASTIRWMDAIAKWIHDGHSIHPILMDTPKSKKGSMKLIIIPPVNGGKHTVQGSEETISPDETLNENGEIINNADAEQTGSTTTVTEKPAAKTNKNKTTTAAKDSI